MTMPNEIYHYTECGLDGVYLVNGFDFVNGASGRRVVIKDIDGLHAAIGRKLIDSRKLPARQSCAGHQMSTAERARSLVHGRRGVENSLYPPTQALVRWGDNRIGMEQIIGAGGSA